jgi:hypothetical protein
MNEVCSAVIKRSDYFHNNYLTKHPGINSEVSFAYLPKLTDTAIKGNRCIRIK